ncbi:hypothetical protein M404DRAFT_1003361 [Pisolithus tinctorius Marx 270]|uniref:Uncharacterized protein n=1 Tax=Pisolithus tinctorius Marx 270 TaxID=870435 RepID=A0A0C3NJA6_PISTI|nr:hypothetical protein M404DRAFT_1003361 [Pisolithus tinctorius Marx 270]
MSEENVVRPRVSERWWYLPSTAGYTALTCLPNATSYTVGDSTVSRVEFAGFKHIWCPPPGHV